MVTDNTGHFFCQSPLIGEIWTPGGRRDSETGPCLDHNTANFSQRGLNLRVGVFQTNQVGHETGRKLNGCRS